MTIDCKEGNELYCKRISDYIRKSPGNGKDEALPCEGSVQPVALCGEIFLPGL